MAAAGVLVQRGQALHTPPLEHCNTKINYLLRFISARCSESAGWSWSS